MGSSRPVPESSAMVVHRNTQGSRTSSVKGRNNPSSGKANNFICDYCGEKGNLKQRFHEIIGYPDWWDFSKKPRKNLTCKAAVTTQRNVRSIQDEQSQSTANMVQLGNFGKVDVFSITSKDSTWIIDTEASDHMTRDSLQTIHPSPQSVVSTANGSTSPITGEGSIVLSNTLKLVTVLVVPSLECNLLSVSPITLYLNYIVTFWPSFCIFQDILNRKRGKLYCLELTEDGEHKFGHACHTSGVENAKEKIWLWHRRLGHVSFGYLKKLQPSLFSDIEVSYFQCNTCELAKRH